MKRSTQNSKATENTRKSTDNRNQGSLSKGPPTNNYTSPNTSSLAVRPARQETPSNTAPNRPSAGATKSQPQIRTVADGRAQAAASRSTNLTVRIAGGLEKRYNLYRQDRGPAPRRAPGTPAIEPWDICPTCKRVCLHLIRVIVHGTDNQAAHQGWSLEIVPGLPGRFNTVTDLVGGPGHWRVNHLHDVTPSSVNMLAYRNVAQIENAEDYLYCLSLEDVQPPNWPNTKSWCIFQLEALRDGGHIAIDVDEEINAIEAMIEETIHGISVVPGR